MRGRERGGEWGEGDGESGESGESRKSGGRGMGERERGRVGGGGWRETAF